jgi:xanthine dehydrogenase YagR molybdenum-binding subunit
MVDWAAATCAKTLGIPKEKVRLVSPFIGGGFGGKLFLRADALLAALGARAARRPVKVALQRALMPTTRRTGPRPSSACASAPRRDGRSPPSRTRAGPATCPTASPRPPCSRPAAVCGRQPDDGHAAGRAGPARGNAMRAPGEGTGLMALEIAMDEMAKLPRSCASATTQVVPASPGNDTQKVDAAARRSAGRPFSQRQLVQCLRTGRRALRLEQAQWRSPARCATAAGWSAWAWPPPYRNNLVTKSAARVRLDARGIVTVETDMTDIGTGSYTIIAQTAAEMMGVPLGSVFVRLGDSNFPVSSGSGGQWGANSSTAGVYAACVKLREAVAGKLGIGRRRRLRRRAGARRRAQRAARRGGGARAAWWAEDSMEYGDLAKKYQQSTFGAHFVEVGVDAFTAEIRVRRMLAVCAAGRILNPKSARSQVIGAMTMGVGAR